MLELLTNTHGRVKKTSDTEFTLLVASVQHKVLEPQHIEIQGRQAKLTVEYGDFSEPLSKVVAYLKEVGIQVSMDFTAIETGNHRAGQEIRCKFAPRGHD